LVYPELGHINKLRHYGKAEFSKNARAAHQRGECVLIEHVSPLRDMTKKAYVSSRSAAILLPLFVRIDGMRAAAYGVLLACRCATPDPECAR
jgi:hypothetical protein